VTATVLIVDDSSFIVEGLTAILRKSYRPLPTFGGEECLAVLRTEKPDVIVLDIMMEPMDGWETLARIKENPATRHIPVLMFSAKKVSPEEAEAHRIGIDDFLTKPVSPKELITAIEKILERDRQNKAIIYHWGKAGIPRAKIDEFLTCSSNIEVDSSLLAAMKKQLGHPTTTPVRHDDLAASVAMLEERIANGRAALDTFIRTTGLTLPSPSDMAGMPAETGLPASQDVPAPAPETQAGVPSSPQGPPGMPGNGNAGAETVAAPQEIPPPPVPASPAPEPVAAGNGTGPVPGDLPLTGAGDIPGGAPQPSPEPEVLDPVPAAGAADDSTTVPPRIAQEPAGEVRRDSNSVEWIAIPSYADPLPKKKLPAAADWAPSPGPVKAGPGSGTSVEIPLPLATRYGQSTASRERKTVQPDAGEQIGFFSRIIAMIAGIFSRGKK